MSEHKVDFEIAKRLLRDANRRFLDGITCREAGHHVQAEIRFAQARMIMDCLRVSKGSAIDE